MIHIATQLQNFNANLMNCPKKNDFKWAKVHSEFYQILGLLKFHWFNPNLRIDWTRN